MPTSFRTPAGSSAFLFLAIRMAVTEENSLALRALLPAGYTGARGVYPVGAGRRQHGLKSFIMITAGEKWRKEGRL
jgi:hypothetical protein